jgi:hypothetical protein
MANINAPWTATIGDDQNACNGRIIDCTGQVIHLSAIMTEDDKARLNMMAAAPVGFAALARAESFISGFEGDEMQEGIADLLKEIRGALEAAGERAAPVETDPYEIAARAAGWDHGGDFDGFWFDGKEFGSWKEAASADEAATYATAQEVCEAEGITVDVVG